LVGGVFQPREPYPVIEPGKRLTFNGGRNAAAPS